MGQESAQIRQNIEDTRTRMGETVEAIGYKADVPSRVRDAVSDKVETVKGSIGSALSGLSGARADAGERAGDLADATTRSTKRAVSMAAENPLGLALGALAIGFIGGLVLPVSDVERERIGPVSGALKDRAQTVIGEAVEAGKTALREGASAAMASAQQQAPTIARHATEGTPTTSVATPPTTQGRSAAYADGEEA